MMLAGVLFGFFSETDRGAFAEGILIKVGTTLFVAWLAYPQLEKLNWWVVVATMLTVAVLVFRPQLAIPAARIAIALAPILFLMWLFKPTRKQGTK